MNPTLSLSLGFVSLNGGAGAAQPTIVQFSFTGTGSQVAVSLGFRPDLIVWKDAGTGYAYFYHDWCWRARRPYLGRPIAHSPHSPGSTWGRMTDDGFVDGLNTLGVVYHGGLTISAAVGLLWYLWTQFQSYRATTMAQVVTTAGQKILPVPGSVAMGKVETQAKAAPKRQTLWEQVTGK